jgi:AcrR family transcriptional regulator
MSTALAERRNNSSGRATREQIVLVAEELFAARGIEAVSLREIGQAAGQRNNAATQYHFGDRAGLIGAIFTYRSESNDPRRQELLAGIDPGQPGALTEIVRALVVPVADHVAEPGNHYVGFLDRWFNAADEYARPIIAGPESPAMTQISGLLHRCLPGLPEAVVDRRLSIILQWMVRSLAAYERATTAGAADVVVPPLEVVVDELIVMLAAAIGAAIGAPIGAAEHRAGPRRAVQTDGRGRRAGQGRGRVATR